MLSRPIPVFQVGGLPLAPRCTSEEERSLCSLSIRGYSRAVAYDVNSDGSLWEGILFSDGTEDLSVMGRTSSGLEEILLTKGDKTSVRLTENGTFDLNRDKPGVQASLFLVESSGDSTSSGGCNVAGFPSLSLALILPLLSICGGRRG